MDHPPRSAAQQEAPDTIEALDTNWNPVWEEFLRSQREKLGGLPSREDGSTPQPEHERLERELHEAEPITKEALKAWLIRYEQEFVPAYRTAAADTPYLNQVPLVPLYTYIMRELLNFELGVVPEGVVSATQPEFWRGERLRIFCEQIALDDRIVRLAHELWPDSGIGIRDLQWVLGRIAKRLGFDSSRASEITDDILREELESMRTEYGRGTEAWAPQDTTENEDDVWERDMFTKDIAPRIATVGARLGARLGALEAVATRLFESTDGHVDAVTDEMILEAFVAETRAG